MTNTHYNLIDTPTLLIEGRHWDVQTFNMGLGDFLKKHAGNSLYILRSSVEDGPIRAIVIPTKDLNQSEWQKKLHVGSSLPAKEGQFAMFVGRWQPLHEGHQSLFKQAMDEGKNVLICIRDIKPDEKNPFTAEEVKNNIMNFYSQEVIDGKVKVMVIPDICSIEFGRGVGYDIIERIPPTQIGEISATKIREQMKKDGTL